LLLAAGYSKFVVSSTRTHEHDAQPENLLQNPKADAGLDHWRVFGNASIEESSPGNPCFVVRNKGSFSQEVLLPVDIGQHVLMIGRVSSERINEDGAITGLPYLYGYMLESDRRILEHLQGQNMLCSAKIANEWVWAWGIYQIPTGTAKLRFFLNQAERNGVPQDGSAARFDDLGLYIFDTKEEAHNFINEYIQQRK
jgi:hypothetical protein